MVDTKRLAADLIRATFRNPCINVPHCLVCGDVMVPIKGGIYGCESCLQKQAQAEDNERQQRDEDAEKEFDPCQ